MIYLLCGVPGSGKSWVANQVRERFIYLSHDKHTHKQLVELSVRHKERPILIDCPFDERRLRAQLEVAGCEVTPLFIVETPKVVNERYHKREGHFPSSNVTTRAETIKEKVAEWKAFSGTSKDVLEYLKDL